MSGFVRREYLKQKSKREKGKLLDEAEKRTGLERKYLIKKLKPKSNLDKRKEDRKKRKVYYDGYVKATLVQIWRIFDYPCGQRLEPLLKTETDRLRKLEELKCSDETAVKLKEISFRTIDEKLKRQKEIERIRKKYQKKVHPLLYQKIPVKLSDEWDRSQLGNIQTDLIEHCGQSVRGEYINTVSNTDIALGWWEPVIKLISKERMGGKIHRQYKRPKTPYQRVLQSKEVSREKKEELKKIYLSLNPAELKRATDRKLDLLYKTYEQKNKSQKAELFKKLKPISVRKYIAQPEPISVSF